MRKLLVGIVLVVGIFIVFSFLISTDEKDIQSTVQKKGGEVVSVEQRVLNTGPFHFVGKNARVYHFIYEVNGKEKEGWMRTGIFHNEYVLNQKKDK